MLTRRTSRALRTALVAALAVLLPGPVLLGSPAPAGAADRARPVSSPAGPALPLLHPDVVLIKTDDQVMDDLTRMQAFMPQVAAWFSAQGREYANSVVSSPSCCQSRASTFVGRYPHNEGVWSQGGGAALDARGGMAPYLQRAGYYTAIVGKYLNLVWSDPPGYDDWTTVQGSCGDRAATEFCTSQDPTVPSWYYGFTATDRTGAHRVPGDPRTGAGYNTAWTGDRFLSYLDKAVASPRPFFLEYDPTAPHTHDSPLSTVMPAPQYRSLPVPGCTVPHEADRSDKPAFVRAWPDRPTFGTNVVCPAAQRALRSVDDVFGQVLQRLRTSGRLSNTLIIFTSDNGLLYGEHGMQRKFVAYDPSVRVPLLLAWPGHVAPGRSTDPVSNLDLLPTVLEAAGITPDPALPPLDGHSLLSGPRHPVLLSEYRADPGWVQRDPAPVPTWAASWDGHRAYVETYSDKAGTQLATQELYDLDRDPGELTNLLALDPARNASSALARQLRRQLAQLRVCAGTTGSSACP